MTKIIGALYLCSAEEAREFSETLSEQDLIVNVTSDIEYYARSEMTRIVIEDTAAYSITPHFEVVDKIHEKLEQNRSVLVHCRQGVSRSATIVLAYLMKYQNMTLKTALEKVRELRPIVRPNIGFFNELLAFESELTPDMNPSMHPWVYMDMSERDYESFISTPSGTDCTVCTYTNLRTASNCEMCDHSLF